MKQPVLETERLRLRPFTLSDAPEVQRLAGDRAVAATTLNIPHPYEDGVAEEWIGRHREKLDSGQSVAYAITLRGDGTLVGAVGLELRLDHERAEMGYWIGRPFWGHGYCTEAARALLAYGFDRLGLNRIYACHFASNPASGRVMQKIGMAYEGRRREHLKKWNALEDMVVYGMLRRDYNARPRPS